MSAISNFLQSVKDNYDEFEAELVETHSKLKAEGQELDSWAATQLEILKADIASARSEIEQLSNRVKSEADEAAEDARARAQKHWKALRAGIAAYREHIESPEASNPIEPTGEESSLSDTTAEADELAIVNATEALEQTEPPSQDENVPQDSPRSQAEG